MSEQLSEKIAREIAFWTVDGDRSREPDAKAVAEMAAIISRHLPESQWQPIKNEEELRKVLVEELESKANLFTSPDGWIVNTVVDVIRRFFPPSPAQPVDGEAAVDGDGWVTLGTIHVDPENETEMFTPAAPAAPVEDAQPPRWVVECLTCSGTDHQSERHIQGKAFWHEFKPYPVLRAAPSPAAVGTAEADDYVAWCRYDFTNEETTGTTISVCDSDAPGAFKVYRHPSPPLPNLPGEGD